jgi:tRNA nucleotidyltransferase/poly(A) polymerase
LKKLLLRAEYPSKGLELARELEIVQRDMPELQSGWSKMLTSLDAAAELLLESQITFSNDQSLIVMLAALCSQLDAPESKSLLARWTFSKAVTVAAVQVASACRSIPQDEAGLRKVVRNLAPTPWHVFIIAAEAITKKSQKKIRTILQDLESRGEFLPLLEGRDLIKLGFTPGPKIGELLRAVEEARDLGKIKTREEALAFCRKGL